MNGPLLLVRMDKDNEPQHMSLTEWTTWSSAELAKPITEEMLKDLEAKVSSANNDEEENDSDEDDDDGGFSKEEQDMLEKAIKSFGDEHGRPPTEVEVRNVLTLPFLLRLQVMQPISRLIYDGIHL